MPVIVDEHTQYLTDSGKPIVNGKLFIGVVNQDPKLNPQPIFADRELTTPIPNPQSTDSFGRTVNKAYVAGRYSVKLENSAQVQIFQDFDRGENPTTGAPISLVNLQGFNDITAQTQPPITAYLDKQQYVFKTTGGANTGPMTLKLETLAVVPIKDKGVDIQPGQFSADTIVVVVFNSIAPVFELISISNFSAATFEGNAGGTTINEFSTDGTLAGDSDDAVPTEQAVKTAIETASTFEKQLLHIQDQKTTGTAGGSFMAGAERTRDLNTVLTNEIAGASLSSNQITLPEGTYYIEASAPAFAVNKHRIKVRDITGAADLIIGTSERSEFGSGVVSSSDACGRFTLSVSSLIEIQHRCTTTSNTDGFGEEVNVGPHEVYTDVRIWKVGS